MNYKEYTFTIQNGQDFHQDLLINALAELGFDTFQENEGGFSAYIAGDREIEAQLSGIADEFEGLFNFTYESRDIPHQNWNQVWESNFEPLRINDRCYVRATFHEAHPEYEFEIVVDPKMAFGTGHHQTTASMMELMMADNFAGKNVLDMGCGTGILAILASMMGAKELVAIDYDPVCYESTIENCSLNKIANVLPLCGSKEAIPEQQFDIILANINRNILLDQIGRYAEVLVPGGLLFLSGFYEEPDLQIIREECQAHGLSYRTHKVADNWVAAAFSADLNS